MKFAQYFQYGTRLLFYVPRICKSSIFWFHQGSENTAAKCVPLQLILEIKTKARRWMVNECLDGPPPQGIWQFKSS